MEIIERLRLMEEPATDPYFEMHLDLTHMTKRECLNAMTVLRDACRKFDVVLGGA